LALLINHHKLKVFTELVYIITGKNFSKYINRGLLDQNFNLCLISLTKKGRIKRILQLLLDNEWNEFNHIRVQLSSNLRLEVRPRMLSTEKNNNLPRIIMSQNILQKYAELVL
jgi:hypothetical protein